MGRTRGVALVGAGAIGVARLGAQGLQFVLFISAARVLSVADFGRFSLLFAIATGLAVLAEGGWREQVVACEDARTVGVVHGLALRDGAFWASWGAAALAMAALSGTVGSAVLTVGILLLPWVVLRPLAAVREGVLTRSARLNALALITSLAEVASCLAGLVLLADGAGLSALAGAKLTLLGVQLAGLVLAGGGVWRAHAEPVVIGQMRCFSRQVRSARVLNFLQWNLATLLAGLAFAPAAVGLYRAAIRLAGLVQDVIGEPARVFGWAFLRRTAEHDRACVPIAALRLLDATLSVACAPLLLLALLSRPIVALLLGSAWQDAAPILTLLALGAIGRLVTMTTDPLLPLIGRADLTQQLAQVTLAANVLALVVAVPFGIMGVAAAGLLAAVVSLGPAMGMLVRDARLSGSALAWAMLPSLAGAITATIAATFLSSAALAPGASAVTAACLMLLSAYAVGQALTRVGRHLLASRGFS
ncbi:oligosaccharide flippase family protein [Novosphingobium sp.]|uniref:oligosaccharide flippase family protein n=1 Tax=Novosphingobium sp. TaxID=1874826 RepID=UPI0038B6CE82